MEAHVLEGLDVNNPLAIMAALGAFRLITEIDVSARMSWVKTPQWRPCIHSSVNRDALSREICSKMKEVKLFVPPMDEAEVKSRVKYPGKLEPWRYAEAAHKAFQDGNKLAMEILASVATNGVESEGGGCIPSMLIVANGGSHQYVFCAAINAISATTEARIESTLFSQWERLHVGGGASIGMDVDFDFRPHAKRWSDPDDEADPIRCEAAANALGFIGLSFFPCLPSKVNGCLSTVGMSFLNDPNVTRSTDGKEKLGVYWTCPIWSSPSVIDDVRNMLSMPFLCEQIPSSSVLMAHGIDAVYRSRRFLSSKRNFFSKTCRV